MTDPVLVVLKGEKRVLLWEKVWKCKAQQNLQKYKSIVTLIFLVGSFLALSGFSSSSVKQDGTNWFGTLISKVVKAVVSHTLLSKYTRLFLSMIAFLRSSSFLNLEV